MPKTRLFISYRTKDEKAKLVHERLRGVYGKDLVFFDKENLPTGSRWASELEEGVKNCDAVVAIIGSYWCDSSSGGGIDRLHQEGDWVRKELELALEANKKIFPVLLDVERLPARRFLPKKLQELHDIQCLTIDSTRFGREVKQLILDLEQAGFSSKAKDNTANETGVENLSADKADDRFAKHLNTKKFRYDLTEKEVLGRTKDLKKLVTLLQDSKNLVLLSGLGGIGKTTLVNYYLSEYQQEYDHIGWISCTGDFKNDVLSSLDNAAVLGTDESTDLQLRFQNRIQQLQALSGKNLLVIDNINTPEEAEAVLQYKDHFPTNIQLLMTARVELSGYPWHRIGVLEEADAVALFKKHYTFKKGDTDEQLNAILQHIGRHTLVIEMLAKGMNSSGRLNFTRMLQRIQGKGIQSIAVEAHTERAGRISKQLNEFVAEVIELSFKDIADENWTLLRQLSVLPPILHDFDLAADLLGRTEEAEQEHLDRQLVRLQKKGLLEYNEQGILLHPVLREVILNKAALKYSLVDTLVKHLAGKLHYDSQDATHKLLERQPLMVYGEAVVEQVAHFEEEEVSYLLDRLAYLYENFGQYQIAANWGEKALALAETIFDANHKIISVRQNNLANVYSNLGRYEKAAEMLEAALQSARDNFGEKHPKVAVRQSNLANVYKELGRYEKAAGLLEAALQSDLDNFGEKHPTVAVSQSNLANVYDDLGRYEKAAELLEAALQSDLDNFGEKHPTVAVSQSNLANVYKELGRYEKAAELLEAALQSARDNFGEKHPTVAVRQSNLANVYSNLGRYEKAAELLEAALQSDLDNFGEKHPQVAIKQSNLANVYSDLGRYEKAAELLEAALQSDLDNFGEKHPQVAIKQSNLANVYKELGRYEKAAELLEAALQSDLDNFGEKHPTVAVSQSNLANVYSDLGRYEKAAELLEAALQSDLDNFGEKHPKVAVRQSNLALVYSNLGRYEKAAELLEAALQSNLDNFGEKHPTVATTYNNLAFVYDNQKQYQTAHELWQKALAILHLNFKTGHPYINQFSESMKISLEEGAAAGDAYCEELLRKLSKAEGNQSI